MTDQKMESVEKTDGKVLIFAGTTEGRKLAEVLTGQGVSCVVCVATEYGARVMQEPEAGAGIDLRQGRLDADEMRRLMQEENFRVVVDATHPFAVEVSENIRVSAIRCNVLYLRLKRDTHVESQGQGDKLYCFESSEDCAAFLEGTGGNVLLTTGSKELEVFCKTEQVKERLVVRVLPGTESLRLCETAGIPGSRIIALQGPFSEELNYALLKQFGIEWMVTKESGRTGGYLEKRQAAARAGVSVCVIGNPEKGEGLSFRQVLAKLEDVLGQPLELQPDLQISLIGMGMGSIGGMTMEALEACRQADVVFGAKRLLMALSKDTGCVKKGSRHYPYYLAEDILPCLEELLTGKGVEQNGWEKTIQAAVLFSGDSGFYSGCERLYRELKRWSGAHCARIRILPGISSVSCLAAATGQSWQDAGIVSSHGKATKEQWSGELLRTVRTHEKTFVLTSGLEDVQSIGALMEQENTWREQSGELPVLVVTGYALGYPEEEVRERTPGECMLLDKTGIYTCLIRNPSMRKENRTEREAGIYGQITHGIPDAEFLRKTQPAIPMTKEEVREVLLSKLRLTADAVVYDIGSGTGSVSVEIARLGQGITVYAFECKPEAAELTRQNGKRFGLDNLKVVQGHAPETLKDLPVPTHVFIGGSDGCLEEILLELKRKRNKIRVVVSAVSLETTAKLTELTQTDGYENVEFVHLQVSRSKQAGKYRLMQAENPVTIVSFELGNAGDEK